MKEIEDVMNCSFECWYPTFKKHTFRSEIIHLPDDFISYLNEDGIILPSLPPSQSFLQGYDPRINTPSELLDDDEEERKNNKLPSINGMEKKSEETLIVEAPCFSEVEAAIIAAIHRLNGYVFPKLNWSCPRDATWMTGSLKCCTPGEIFLLLKSSDACASNFSRAFEDCAIREYAGAKFEEDGVSRPSNLYLVLRKWCKLLPSREFRCFVRNHVLIGISQRDSANFYPHLLEEKDQLHEVIDIFFLNNIKGEFKSEKYTFDIYVDQKRKVWLIDFGVYDESSDALLFTWDELNDILITDSETEYELRVVETSGGILPSDLTYFGLPKDALDISSPEGLNEFIQMTKKLASSSLDSDED